MVATIEADLDHGAALRSPDLEAVNAALVRLKDAAWAVQRDRLRTARAVADLAGPEPSRAAIAGYTSIQVALSALDRLEVRGRDSAGIHLLVRDHDLDLESPAVAAQLDGPLERPAVRVHVGPRRRQGPELRLQGGGRDRRAGRQHPGAARATSVATRCSRRRSPASAAAGRRARPHPLGQRRHHLPAQRPPAQRGGDRPGRRPVRGRRAQRRRRQLRRPEDQRGAAHRAGDHHRREGHPHPRVAPARPAASTLDEAFRRTVAGLDGSVAIAASAADAPADLLLAQRGSGQALYVGLADGLTLVASEPYGLVEECDQLPAPGRRDAGRRARPDRVARPGGPPRRRSRRHPRGHRPLELRRPDAAGRVLRAAVAGDHHPRHRPGRPPALPAQGDQRGAGVVPQDAAGQARRAGRQARRVPRPRHPAGRPARRPERRLDRPRDRDRPGHRSRGRAGVRAHARRGHRRHRPAGRGRARHRAVGLRAAHRHERHARRRGQPVGHHHRHEPHRRPRAGPRRARSCRSSTAGRATSPTSPTACSTPPTGATWR